MKILLASKSPRRRELLRACGVEFEVADYQVDESYPAGMLPDEVPLYIALKKADGYPGQLPPDTTLITADTCVICGGEILGKPADRDDARRMLEALSGRTHEVITGVVIRRGTDSEQFSVTTRVEFRELTAAQIDYYIDHYKPYDKAGAYGIQEWIGLVGIRRIEGDFYNVMGLPVSELHRRLSDLGII